MKLAAFLLCLAAAGNASAAASTATPPTLLVCADPNNLPFSNRAGEGLENKIAELVARDMGSKLSYVWWAQRRGYVRNTLNEAKCDIWPGIATGVSMVATSLPYYRSTYVFVTRSADALQGLQLDDVRLKTAAIGVQMIGNDAMNTPPAHAIASRGIIENVRGFMLYGNYTEPNPPSAIVEAVASRQIDVALVWGPLAGYFAAHSKVSLRIEAVKPADDPRWPMQYDISMGVQKKNAALLERINSILTREKPSIEAILRAYQVPQINAAGKLAAESPNTSSPQSYRR